MIVWVSEWLHRGGEEEVRRRRWSNNKNPIFRIWEIKVLHPTARLAIMYTCGTNVEIIRNQLGRFYFTFQSTEQAQRKHGTHSRSGAKCIWRGVNASTLQERRTKERAFARSAASRFATGTDIRVAEVRAEYLNSLNYTGRWPQEAVHM